MDTSKKPFRFSLHALLWTMLLGCLLAHPFSDATSSPPGSDRDYMLIICAYTESSQWSRNIISNVLEHINETDNCEVYTEYMNMLLMKNLEDVEKFKRNLLKIYGAHPPRVLVLLGTPTSDLRDFVKETWPGVPIIYCAEFDYRGSEKAQIDKLPIPPEERRYIRDYVQEDNITFLQSPVYLRENVELMRRMIPGMDKLIFIGDGRYVNQQIDYDLKELLSREFPDTDYRFYSATDMSTDALLDSLYTMDTRRTGVLFSSWHQVKQAGDNIILQADPYRIIASTQVPIFTINSSNIHILGIVGGYIYNDAEYNKHLISVIDQVLSGHQPRDIPFYTPGDARPVFNYPMLERKGLSTHTCPANSFFYDKPESLLKHYKWPILIVGLLLLALIVFQQWRIRMLHNIEESRRRESESQAKYSNLFNNMPIIYIQQQVIFDENHNPADTIFCDVNARFGQLFSREAVIGKRCSEVFPFPMNEFTRMIGIVLTENRTITYPFYYKPLDIFYEVIISQSHLADHVDIFCLDGTALYKAQQKLNSINNKLSMALDVANIVPWKWDLQNGTILCDINKSAQTNMFAVDSDEPLLSVPESSYFSKIHKEDRERVRRAYEDLIAGRIEKVQEEYRVASNTEGRWHLDWVEAQAAVETRDNEGRPLTLVGSSLVITSRKQLEQELRSARDRAEESNRLKSAFLANMSHEIRTPLNAIVGFSGILAQTETQQEKQEYISIIENNNTLLLQLIGDILDLSKIEAGTLEFVVSDFELNELMHEKGNTVGMKAAEGVEFIFEPGLEHCPIRTDSNRLSQVIINLLTNAAKFTQQGSIRYGYELRGRQLYFYVTDTGCGISSEDQEHIFDRFVKLNSFKQGTGLGLSICKTIVERLGGKIGVKSEAGKGSTFWFTIPYTEGKLREIPVEEHPMITVEKDKLTILIAEDNDSNYRLFESILCHDYRLIHAWDGREAVEIFRDNSPHLVLMDINMPVMNGYEAAAEIRKLSADVPIIAITAFAYASDEQRVMQNGFNGYMPKPINASQLKNQILDILRKRMTLI